MKTVQDLKAGDTVYLSKMSRAFSAPVRYSKAVFVRATPSGQCVVTVGGHEVRINKDGREAGGDRYYGYYLELDVERVEGILAREALQLSVHHAVAELQGFVESMSKWPSEEMLDRLDAAVAKVRAAKAALTAFEAD